MLFSSIKIFNVGTTDERYAVSEGSQTVVYSIILGIVRIMIVGIIINMTLGIITIWGK